MAFALPHGLRVLAANPALRPAARRARPLCIRAFKSEQSSKPAAEKQEQAASSSLAPQEQQDQQVIARSPYAAYDVMPFRRMTDVMTQMQREMDTLMDTFGMSSDPFFSRSPFTMLDRLASFPRTTAPAAGRLVPYEFTEDESKYSLKLEVPGFAKDDIKVSLDPNSSMVTVTGQKEAKEGESHSRMFFTRSFTLPQNVDLNQDLKARTEHGVLTLELPKAPEPTPPPVKEIPVEGY